MCLRELVMVSVRKYFGRKQDSEHEKVGVFERTRVKLKVRESELENE